MSEPFADSRFPRGALIGAGTMVGVTLLMVLIVRVSGADIRSFPPPKLLVQRELTFRDLPDGGVAVYDVTQSAPIQVLPPRSNGFLRATMRNLVHERRANGIGPESPFRLAASVDGRLILQDPTTGRSIDLEAFGPTNAGVFASLLGAHE
ncbi:MAG: photosynthetic complex assembly protein PuhC [Proteobacteria bacterium]|nr:photosynthetic complex assembly protein PuhC [Pseudomonadota bacterium]